MTLRRPQTVHYAKTEATEAPGYDRDAFEYRPELGWAWLQRLMFAALRHIGAFRHFTVTTWVRTVEENDELVSALLGQEGEFLSRMYHHDDMRIYVGPDQHPRLLAQMHAMGMHPFSFSGRIKIGEGSCEPEWRSIPITCVPWMEGAVIVPV